MFPPVEVDGRVMVDGAVLNPLPITPCVPAHADLIIAVDLSSDVPNLPDFSEIVEQAIIKEKSQWLHRMAGKTQHWLEDRGLAKTHKEAQEQEAKAQLGKLGVINRVVELMSASR